MDDLDGLDNMEAISDFAPFSSHGSFLILPFDFVTNSLISVVVQRIRWFRLHVKILFAEGQIARFRTAG